MTLNWVRVCLLTLACPLFLILLQVKLALCADTIDERWLALLHYEKTYTGKYESKIKDPHFFITTNGCFEPIAEYQAIHDSLLTRTLGTEEGYACKFPARASFVAEKEGLVFEPWACKRLSYFLNRKLPIGITLVYASPSMKSASTLFGHTFIKLDSESKEGLLDTTISYAAETNNSNDLDLVWNGLTGGFKGVFTATPFYRRLSGYSNIEDRDLWEFPLELTPDESKRVALHSFELMSVSTPYYFMDDNCSGLLWDLIKGSGSLKFNKTASLTPSQVWMTPLDLVQNLQTLGLISRQRYIPSLAKRLELLYTDSNLDQRARVSMLFEDNVQLAQIKLESKIEVDLASALAEYKLSKSEITQENFSQVMSKLPSSIAPQPPMSTSPLKSHKSRMLQIGYQHEFSNSFLNLKIKPTYHSLDDPVDGFPLGMSLDFMTIETHVNLQTASMKLNRLDLIDLNSLTPYKNYSKNVSWKYYLGLNRENMTSGSQDLNFDSLIGLGATYYTESVGNISSLFTLRARSVFRSDEILQISPGLNSHVYNVLIGKFELGVDLQIDFDSKLRMFDRVSLEPKAIYKLSKYTALGVYASLVNLKGESTNINTMLAYKVYF